MRKVILLTAVLVIGLISTSFGFYDNLWTFENTGQNFWDGAIIANGHFVYYMHPDADDIAGDDSTSKIIFPLDVGYAIDEKWGVSFILPIEYWGDLGEQEGFSSFGLMDPWIKAKFIPMLGPNISVGPRIGIRLPFGSDGHAIKRFALDFGGLLKIGYKTSFHLNAQTGVRLEFKKTENDVENKSPSYLYFIAEPGYLINPDIDILGVLGVQFPVADGITNGVDVEGSKNMWFGGKMNYKISPNVTLDGTFQYLIWNKIGDVDMGKDLFFGAGCIATIPL